MVCKAGLIYMENSNIHDTTYGGRISKWTIFMRVSFEFLKGHHAHSMYKGIDWWCDIAIGNDNKELGEYCGINESFVSFLLSTLVWGDEFNINV